jgi:hypothetical protein
MNRWEPVDWWIVVVGPLGCLLIAVPLFAALNHVTARIPTPPLRPAWQETVQQADQAIAERRLADAVRAWHDAHAEALVSRQWMPMVEVGDLSLRVGEATGARGAARARARECYFAALMRARRDGALDGMLRVAESFARLGDRHVVQQVLDAAGTLAERRTRDGAEQYRTTLERLRIRALAVTGVTP